MQSPTARRTARFLASALIACAPSIGCGPAGPQLGTVTGTVELDGAPLPDARVEFQPTARGGSPSYGRTNAAGHYTLQYNREHAGAMVGEHRIRISTERELSSQDPGGPATIPERVPARYNAKSGLTRTVAAGSNTIDFPLESKRKSKSE